MFSFREFFWWRSEYFSSAVLIYQQSIMIIPLLWISFHFCAYALWGFLLCSMRKICLAWADRMILLPTRVFCSNYKCLRFFRMALISHLFRWVFLSRTAENGNGVTLMYSRRKNGDLAHTDTEG